jgi:hypothetical protein
MLRSKYGRNFGEFSDLKILIKSSGREQIFFCPYCEDVKGSPDLEGKFYYNVVKQIGHCFRCETTVSDIGLRSIEQIKLQLDEVSSLEKYREQILNLNGWTSYISSGSPEALEYAVNQRNIYPEVLTKFEVRSCSTPRDAIIFTNRIWIQEGRLVSDFIQLRNINGPLRYSNLADQVKPLCWVNYINSSKVMLVEGFISGMSAYQHLDGEVSPLVLLGKSISGLQLLQLKAACSEKKITQVYVVTDGGFFEDGIKIARILDKELYNQKIYVTKLYWKKDPNNMTRREFLNCFYDRTYEYSKLKESQMRNLAYK